jgi:hypothetical protein
MRERVSGREHVRLRDRRGRVVRRIVHHWDHRVGNGKLWDELPAASDG